MVATIQLQKNMQNVKAVYSKVLGINQCGSINSLLICSV